MDIVLKFGEFYNDESDAWRLLEVAGSVLGVFISAGISIWIFKRGIKAEREKEALGEKNRLLELEEYVKGNVRLLDKPIDQQLRSYLQFVKKLKSKYDENYEVEQIVTLHTENLKQIPHTDLYKIFVRNKKGDINKRTELFQNLDADLQFVNEVNRSFGDTFNHFMRKYDIYVKDWNENLSKIGEANDLMYSEAKRAGLTVGTDPFLDEFFPLFVSWSKLKKYQEWSVALPNLILPLQDLCRRHPADTRVPNILRYITNCIYAYENMKALKAFTWRVAARMAIRLRSARRRLDQTLKEFDTIKQSTN
jgi:hypothetical protein